MSRRVAIPSRSLPPPQAPPQEDPKRQRGPLGTQDVRRRTRQRRRQTKDTLVVWPDVGPNLARTEPAGVRGPAQDWLPPPRRTGTHPTQSSLHAGDWRLQYRRCAIRHRETLHRGGAEFRPGAKRCDVAVLNNYIGSGAKCLRQHERNCGVRKRSVGNPTRDANIQKGNDK